MSNKSTAVDARSYLVSLGRGFHELEGTAKKQIREALSSKFAVPVGAYDLIWLPDQIESPLRKLSKEQLSQLRLVEVKSSARPIPEDLSGYFFSLQYSEQIAAQALGDRYLFVFVICSGPQKQWFYKELRWQDIWGKAKAIHMQWSIRF